MAEELGVATNDEVAGEDDPGVGHDDRQVVVGVSATRDPELDRPAPQDDLARPLDQPVGRVDDDGLELGGHGRLLLRGFASLFLAGLREERDTASVTPDVEGPKGLVAEDVIRVPVGIDHGTNRNRGDRPDIGLDLAGLNRRAPRVDHQATRSGPMTRPMFWVRNG